MASRTAGESCFQCDDELAPKLGRAGTLGEQLGVCGRPLELELVERPSLGRAATVVAHQLPAGDAVQPAGRLVRRASAEALRVRSGLRERLRPEVEGDLRIGRAPGEVHKQVVTMLGVEHFHVETSRPLIAEPAVVLDRLDAATGFLTVTPAELLERHEQLPGRPIR